MSSLYDNMQKQVVLLILLAFAAVGTAITCYDCDSMHDPRCNEYFAPEGVQQTNCDDAEMPLYLLKYGRRIPATGCMTKIQEGVDGLRYFIRRSCYFGDLEKPAEACEAEDPYLPYTSILGCHVCSEDLCNTNDARKTAVMSVFLGLLMVVFACIF